MHNTLYLQDAFPCFFTFLGNYWKHSITNEIPETWRIKRDTDVFACMIDDIIFILPLDMHPYYQSVLRRVAIPIISPLLLTKAPPEDPAADEQR